MTRDEFEQMWGDEPDRQTDGCILLLAVFVLVWAVIVAGAAWLVSR